MIALVLETCTVRDVQVVQGLALILGIEAERVYPQMHRRQSWKRLCEAVVVVRVGHVAVGEISDAAERIRPDDGTGSVGCAGNPVVEVIHAKLNRVLAEFP
jgi:hypothetical protein